MLDTAKNFGKSIRNREDTRSMLHYNVLCIGPIFDGKMLDIDIARPFGRDMVVDHIDSGHIVFIELRKPHC